MTFRNASKRLASLSIAIALLFMFLAACSSPEPTSETILIETNAAGLFMDGDLGTLAEIEPDPKESVMIDDPEATDGRTAALYREGEGVSFDLTNVPSGRYRLIVRARADEYLGWPTMRLRIDNEDLEDKDNSVKRENYGAGGDDLGVFDLNSNQDVEPSIFLNDAYDGSPEKDRNLYIDHLRLEPQGTPDPDPDPEPDPDPDPEPEPAPGPSGSYPISTASFLGDSSSSDEVTGAVIGKDGTIFLAANLTTEPDGISDRSFNGATSDSAGSIVRLSADGKRVLSMTRIGERIVDLAADAQGNLYAALWDDGLVKLDSSAGGVTWSKTPGRVMRVDAGGDGLVAALVTKAGDPDSDTPGAGKIELYGPGGELVNSANGHNNTLDVCLDPASRTVISIGWRQANAYAADKNKVLPVQIAYYRGRDFAGKIKYTGYDWSSDRNAPDFLNRFENNMADSRGYRCAVGADGKLYLAFESAGGNTIFRNSPFDLSKNVRIVGGDLWNTFANTRSEEKTFFGRYEPGTGEYLLGQQLTNRLASNGAGNTINIDMGNIAADSQGRVYVGGSSAYGLPMPPHPRYTPKASETTFNPFPNDTGNLGGAWFMVISPDFSTRQYTTRLAKTGSTRAIAVGAGGIVFGGTTAAPNGTYTTNAFQENAAGGKQDGWFGVIKP